MTNSVHESLNDSIQKNNEIDQIGHDSDSKEGTQEYEHDHEDSKNNSNEDLLFYCKCESVRPILTLLSCLCKLSSTPNLSTSLDRNYSSSKGVSTHSTLTLGKKTTSSNSKSQYATVFVSDQSIIFQVYGVGKQSRATVEMKSGLFSEFYVKEEAMVADTQDNDDSHYDSSIENVNGNKQLPTESEVIKGGEFGINLTSIIDCLCILGSSSLDRTLISLSYNPHAAIFKIELLDNGQMLKTQIQTHQEQPGVVIAECAIPGMCVEDDDDDEHVSLDYLFRTSPTAAHARIHSECLKDAILELNDVVGATTATIGLSHDKGLEFGTFGHTTECHVVIPYAGNHPTIFKSLQIIGNEGSSFSRSYPLHSVLSAMRALDVANETCITINSNGMIAIQHQIENKVGSAPFNYVDFIMGCMDDESAQMLTQDLTPAATSEIYDDEYWRPLHERTTQSQDQKNQSLEQELTPEEDGDCLSMGDGISRKNKESVGPILSFTEASSQTFVRLQRGKRRFVASTRKDVKKSKQPILYSDDGSTSSSGDDYSYPSDTADDDDQKYSSPQLMYGDTVLEDHDNYD